MLVALTGVTLDLAQVLCEMFAWEAVATTSASSLHVDFSGDMTQTHWQTSTERALSCHGGCGCLTHTAL